MTKDVIKDISKVIVFLALAALVAFVPEYRSISSPLLGAIIGYFFGVDVVPTARQAVVAYRNKKELKHNDEKSA